MSVAGTISRFDAVDRIELAQALGRRREALVSGGPCRQTSGMRWQNSTKP
jgi:hypothetical protein